MFPFLICTLQSYYNVFQKYYFLESILYFLAQKIDRFGTFLRYQKFNIDIIFLFLRSQFIMAAIMIDFRFLPFFSELQTWTHAETHLWLLLSWVLLFDC